MDGSKFEPSIFYLLESQNLVFLKKKYIHDIFFASSPARLAVYIRDPSPLYTASFAGLEVEKVKCSPAKLAVYIDNLPQYSQVRGTKSGNNRVVSIESK